MYTEIKDRIVKSFFSGLLEKVLKEWELRVTVLLSLIIQVVLAYFGNRRKFQGKYSRYVSIVVWWTYLLADWVATVALSTLLKADKKDLKCGLVVSRTPFLLLHLGGPDTINAYSLADNELWLRSLLGFFVQVGVAVFVYMRLATKCGTPTYTNYTAIPIFFAGVIKYGERIWILRAASRRRFSNSLFSTAKASKTKEITSLDLEQHLKSKNVIEEGKYIHEAFCMFKMSIPLFLDLKLKIPQKLSKFFIPSFRSANDAFKLVEVELGFLYDVLYTKKTSWPQPKVGVILHCICSLSTFTTLIAFSIVFDKNGSLNVDILITYILLGGAMFLNIYSAIVKASSSWTMHRLSIRNNWISKFVGNRIAYWYLQRNLAMKKQGIAYMAQYSLIVNCLKTKGSRWRKFVKFFDTEDILGKLVLTTWEKVNDDVKKFIHDHLVEKQSKYRDGDQFKYEYVLDLLSKKGDGVLQMHNVWDKFCWSVTGLEFNHCLFIWHIATDLLFHIDLSYSTDELGSHCKISKHLSDYMMYLLLVRPNMLPKGISEQRMKETQNEVMDLFKKNSLSGSEVWDILLDLQVESEGPSQSKSVIAEGCKLASILHSLDEEESRDHSAKWKLIADVWMEIMAFAASRCEWREHKIQLRRGGELLTHVALLMAHVGLTDRIEIMSSDGTCLHWDSKELPHLPHYLV